MPYCLIGKIAVWGARIVLLAVLIRALVTAYDRLADRLRTHLHPSQREIFFAERIFESTVDILEDVFDRIGLEHLPEWLQEKVAYTLFLPIFAILILPAFLELGLRYAIYHLRKSTAPTTLA